MISLDWIAQREYLGRGFIIGKTQGEERAFAVYFITGRSPSSRARKFELDGNAVKTIPTDPEVLKKGNPALLIYPALLSMGDYLIVSNGAQTDFIASFDSLIDPIYNLVDPLRTTFMRDGIDLTSYEPDHPNYTPRISGVSYTQDGSIAICKRNMEQVERAFYKFPLVPGFGKFISTYTGRNVPKGTPLPSFSGEPLDFVVTAGTIEEVAQKLYDALGPQQGKDDFRVGVVAAYVPKKEKLNPVIINRS